MRRLLLPLSLVAVLLAAGLAGVYALMAPTAPEAGPAKAAVSATPATAGRPAPTPGDEFAPSAPRAARAIAKPARYALTYTAAWTMDGAAQAPITIAAVWDAMSTADGQQVQVSQVKISEHPALPAAAELEGTYGLHADAGGALRRFTWPAASGELARRTFATLASAFWLTEAPGAEWAVDEDDVAGRYHARYQRTGEVVEKVVERWLGVRGPKGLDARPAATMTPGGTTRFEFDARGLRRVLVATTLDANPGDAAPRVVVRIDAELVRLDEAPRIFAAAVGPTGAFSGLVDFQGQDAQVDAELVGTATLSDLLAASREAARLGRDTAEGRQARSLVLRQLSALVRLDPSAAKGVADAILDRAAAGEPIDLLTGALASTGDAAGTDALADLIGDDLPSAHKRNAINSLGLSHQPTSKGVEALTEALDGPEADAAAMALGNQARKLAEDAPEEAASAVDLLLARYTQATTVAEKVTSLQALANTGDRRALPAMQDAIASGDQLLRPLGIEGLRFIPGDDVDAALQPWVMTGNLGAREALTAVRYRSPDRWRPTLEQARQAYSQLGESGANFVEAIDQLLAAWAS